MQLDLKLHRQTVQKWFILKFIHIIALMFFYCFVFIIIIPMYAMWLCVISSYVPMCVAKTFNISTSNSLEEQFIILSLFYSFFCLMPMTMFVRRFNVSTNKKKEDITKREGVKLPYNSFVAHYMRSTIQIESQFWGR